MKEFLIQRNEENQRLDRYLNKLMPLASKSFIQKMLRKKRIKLNSQKSEPQQIILSGDRVQIFFSEETLASFRRASKGSTPLQRSDLSAYKFDILYEDSRLLVLNKPPNLLVHPDNKNEVTLIDLATEYLIQKNEYNPSENLTFSPACANRLDKNTTGIVLIPKDYPTLQQVTKDIREKNTKKIYMAFVKGTPPPSQRLTAYLEKDTEKNNVSLSKTRTSRAQKKVELFYKTIESHSGYSLLEIDLITGRSHQIRVQLASIGCPILGDPKYGDLLLNKALNKDFELKFQLLHNYRFTLVSQNQTFIAPYPPHFIRALKFFHFSNTALKEVHNGLLE
ncbi:MAG: RluA family pseudouridine synthase [Eubacteriaceae bacterium]